MATVEFLRVQKLSHSMRPIMEAMVQAAWRAGDETLESSIYHGGRDWLVVTGVGMKANDNARKAQIAKGGRVLHWDHGYFRREKITGYMRMCIDSDHPQQWLDRTPADPARWDSLGLSLREDCDQNGHIVLVGMGAKSRAYQNQYHWEEAKAAELRRRFPRRRIVFRPKGRDSKRLHGFELVNDFTRPIEDVLRGASLVVCRHSNVACDAVLAGIPFECEDGAAAWLKDKPFDFDTRLDFLRRLAHWQYKPHEADAAWQFAKDITA